MSDSRLPTEVELVYEVMPCNAMRVAQEPGKSPHACSYFRKWGSYHSYDYVIDEAPPEPGIIHKIKYVGRAPLVPELLSGHMMRARGACVLCPMLEIGPCDYVDELQPIALAPALTADSPLQLLQEEKAAQMFLMGEIKSDTTPVEEAWAGSDEIREGDPTTDG